MGGFWVHVFLSPISITTQSHIRLSSREGMTDRDSIELEQRQIRERGRQESDAGNPADPCEDSGSALLPVKSHIGSFASVESFPKVTAIRHDAIKKAKSMSQMARYLGLCAFVIVEAIWLGFALYCHFRIIVTSSDQSTITLPGGLSTNRDTLLKSGLSTIGIIVQFIALFPVSGIVVEMYSGEWAHILAREDGQLTQITDRVSTLTSGYMEQLAHFLYKKSSLRYRIAFVVALLSLLIQALAPGALTISSDAVRTDMDLTIGALDSGQIATDDDGFRGTENRLAQQVVTDATRYLYSKFIQNATVDYNLDSDARLFGMPPRNMLVADHLEYISDAVQYRYECQWLAPTYVVTSEFEDFRTSLWAFGGDMTGVFDVNNKPINSEVDEVSGVWPLLIASADLQTSIDNGSFAWLFVGGGSDALLMDLSSVPQTTYNSSGWQGLLPNDTDESGFISSSTNATILFCDPYMQMVTVQVTLQDQQLHSNVISNNGSVGNIDWVEASRMLGRSLNGLPWDSAQTNISGLLSMYTLSDIAATFALQPTTGSFDGTPLLPRPLEDLAKTLQSYVTVAGANAYLDGSVSNTTVTAQRLKPIQRLVCSWPQWSASVALFALISFLMFGMIFMEGVKKASLVPLTLASVVAAIHPGSPDSPQMSPIQDAFDAKSPLEKSC